MEERKAWRKKQKSKKLQGKKLQISAPVPVDFNPVGRGKGWKRGWGRVRCGTSSNKETMSQ